MEFKKNNKGGYSEYFSGAYSSASYGVYLPVLFDYVEPAQDKGKVVSVHSQKG